MRPAMRPRLSAALMAGRAAAVLSRRLGRGGGTVIAGHLVPRLLGLHNIFRDQLDRYGEVHFVANLWRDAILRLPSRSQVLINADDPLVAGLAPGPALSYGIEDAASGTPTLPHAADARLCPR